MVGLTTLIIKRFSENNVRRSLEDTPVVLVSGPRQCGKTTLVRSLTSDRRTYITLDEASSLAAARADPVGMIRGLDRATIDEVQLAPDLLRAIKKSVDEDRRPGRFLLTGSANILTVPKVAESLAGRMEIISLLPLSVAEVCGSKPVFLANAFEGKVAAPARTLVGADLIQAIVAGGYPEMLTRKSSERQQSWARSYVRSIVQRDIRELTSIEKLDQIPKLLRVLAECAAQLMNFTQAGGHIGLNDKTIREYVGILESLFLIRRIEPWAQNRLSRLVKTPKLHFLDSGLLAALRGLGPDRVTSDRALLGPLLETFVFSEILKQSSWSDGDCSIFHYRDKEQAEVDFVIENNRGEIVGLEIKSSATVSSNDFRGLRKVLAATGRKFKAGIVLYDGDQVLSFGERLFAGPISSLFGARSAKPD